MKIYGEKYAIESNEMVVFNYLKTMALNIQHYKSFDNSLVKDCSLNFGDYSVNIEIHSVKNINEHIKHFCNYCEEFKWCDKNSLDELDDDIRWTAILEDGDKSLFASTESWYSKGILYMAIRLH